MANWSETGWVRAATAEPLMLPMKGQWSCGRRCKPLSVVCLSTADKLFTQRFLTSPECMKILDP
jgi:hypothetical protein